MLSELFIKEVSHVEIGEFENEEAYQLFLQLHKNSGKSFGLHSPLLRNDSKYDLIENVFSDTEKAWIQFENEMKLIADAGGAYILVHFPYFKDKSHNPILQIEKGLQRLSDLQTKYKLPIICEPKLGLWKSTKGIEYLSQFPLTIWEKYGLKLCIDIGDYLMALGNSSSLDMIEKWRDHIKVVHLHNIEFIEDKYIWVPIHPSHEKDGVHYPIKEIVSSLAECRDLYWVLEHTPHSNPQKEFILEGIQWLKQDILKIE
jgi:sugar phosphate isomerase/epimerase